MRKIARPSCTLSTSKPRSSVDRLSLIRRRTSSVTRFSTLDILLVIALRRFLSKQSALHPAESPLPSATTIPPTPETPPFQPHPRAARCVQAESSQSAPSATPVLVHFR